MAAVKKRAAKRTAKTSAKKSATQVMAELKKCGNAKTRKIFERHGARNLFGVSVADMKVIAKSIKGQQELACQLYETGNDDAMYLAGIVADGAFSQNISRVFNKPLEERSVHINNNSQVFLWPEVICYRIFAICLKSFGSVWETFRTIFSYFF